MAYKQQQKYYVVGLNLLTQHNIHTYLYFITSSLRIIHITAFNQRYLVEFRLWADRYGVTDRNNP